MRSLKPLSFICICFCIACNNSSKDGNAATGSVAAPSPVTGPISAQPLSRPADMPANIIIRAIAVGDLNKDALADSVIVTVDTAADTEPVTLKVFLATGNGFTPVINTSKAISPLRRFGKDGYADGNDFDTATIDAGILSISEQQLRGHTECKFRYQDGHFELIGYTSSQSDGHGTAYDTDYNLMTDRLIYSESDYETDSVLKKRDVRVKLPQRPKLEDYEPGETKVKKGDVDILL